MECKQNKKNEWKIEANEIHVFSLVDFRIDRRMIKHRTKKSEWINKMETHKMRMRNAIDHVV